MELTLIIAGIQAAVQILNGIIKLVMASNGITPEQLEKVKQAAAEAHARLQELI